MMRKLAKLMGIVFIREDELVEIAKTYCAKRDWPWIGPVEIRHSLLKTSIMTNAGFRGGNAWIVIDARNGHVDSAGFASR